MKTIPPMIKNIKPPLTYRSEFLPIRVTKVLDTGPHRDKKDVRYKIELLDNGENYTTLITYIYKDSLSGLANFINNYLENN